LPGKSAAFETEPVIAGSAGALATSAKHAQYLSMNRKCCLRFALSAGEGARVPSISGPYPQEESLLLGKAMRRADKCSRSIQAD
jgi:hypothetical protein